MLVQYFVDTRSIIVLRLFAITLQIIVNPPFSVELDNDTKKTVKKDFMFGEKKNSENLFVERWYQLLRENGRLAAVLPESVFDTAENKYQRHYRDHQLQTGDGPAADIRPDPDGQTGRAEAEGGRPRSRLIRATVHLLQSDDGKLSACTLEDGKELPYCHRR